MEETRHPEDWAREDGIRVVDPDGWRNAGVPWDFHLTRKQFDELLRESTIDTRPRIRKGLLLSNHDSGTAPDLNASTDAPETVVLELSPRSLDYKIGEVISYWRTDYVVDHIEFQNGKRSMHLTRADVFGR